MVPFSNTDCTTGYDKNYKDKFENTPAIDFDLFVIIHIRIVVLTRNSYCMLHHRLDCIRLANENSVRNTVDSVVHLELLHLSEHHSVKFTTSTSSYASWRPPPGGCGLTSEPAVNNNPVNS